MGRSLLLFLPCAALLVALAQSASPSCLLTHKLHGGATRSFSTCQALPQQGATLAWTYVVTNSTISLAFTAQAPSSSGWVGWGINLTPTPGMVGSDTLIAFTSNGTSRVESYSLTRESLANLRPGPFARAKLVNKAVEIEGAVMTIFAQVQLPKNLSSTVVNHIWNRGPGVVGLSPLPHSMSETSSIGRINIATGALTQSSAPHQTLKNRHGILNTVGWGVLLPLGVMSARYLRPFPSADPAWFYIHAFCQSSGYVLGVIGWATGIKLGSYSSATFTTHRNLGITIFVFGTLQILSLLLRPKKDHPVRKYWNVYHHSIGYATIAMAIANVFQGFNILQPQHKWRHAYIGVIASLAGLSLVLELITWLLYLTSKKRSRALEDAPKASADGRALNGAHTTNGWASAPAA